jgi:hypothetical protein
VSLDDASYAARDVIHGRIALDGLVDHECRALSLVVVTERRVRVEEYDYEEERLEPVVSLLARESFVEGEPVTFSVSVPDGATTGHATWVQARWSVDAHTIHWRIPISIVDAEPRVDRSPPPTVGRERWREVWRAAAESHGLEIDPEGAMHGEAHGLAFEIAVDDRLVARVRRHAGADPVELAVATWHAHDADRFDDFVRKLDALCESLAATEINRGPYR